MLGRLCGDWIIFFLFGELIAKKINRLMKIASRKSRNERKSSEE
jgi:hypothetical protein